VYIVIFYLIIINIYSFTATRAVVALLVPVVVSFLCHFWGKRGFGRGIGFRTHFDGIFVHRCNELGGRTGVDETDFVLFIVFVQLSASSSTTTCVNVPSALMLAMEPPSS
jgi:hypothetical protein